MFVLSCLWPIILFDFGALHSFITASCVRELDLEVETLEELMHVNSPLGTRVSVDLICQGCELDISGILLTLDLRVMDMTKFDFILGMDWLTTHRVLSIVSVRELLLTHRMVLALRFMGTSTMLCPRPCMTPNGMGS